MKKLLAVSALLALSTVSYAKEVVSGGDIFVDNHWESVWSNCTKLCLLWG